MSSTVAGRSPPSRWSCSRAFGGAADHLRGQRGGHQVIRSMISGHRGRDVGHPPRRPARPSRPGCGRGVGVEGGTAVHPAAAASPGCSAHPGAGLNYARRGVPGPRRAATVSPTAIASCRPHCAARGRHYLGMGTDRRWVVPGRRPGGDQPAEAVHREFPSRRVLPRSRSSTPASSSNSSGQPDGQPTTSAVRRRPAPRGIRRPRAIADRQPQQGVHVR